MRLRRSMMFIPGNTPKMLNNADIYGADSLIFDLEDTIPISQKEPARIMVAQALRCLDFNCEKMVRINGLDTPYGWDDLRMIAPAHPDCIRLPKAEQPKDIQDISEFLDQVEKEHGFEHKSIKIMVAIESVKGLYNAVDIATASPRVVALGLGGEDFRAELGVHKTTHSMELFAERSQIILAARMAGVQVIDMVYPAIYDEEGFRQEVQMAKDMGFNGKSIVHPSQIPIVHKVFTPTDKQIEQSRKILDAYKYSVEHNLGVIAVDGKMVDLPVVARAERVLEEAKAAHIISDEEENVQ